MNQLDNLIKPAKDIKGVQYHKFDEVIQEGFRMKTYELRFVTVEDYESLQRKNIENEKIITGLLRKLL